jgi:maleylacetate reductase
VIHPPARTVQDSGDVVLFGPDSAAGLPAELASRGAERVLVVASPRWPALRHALAAALGSRHAGSFTDVAPQVPERVARAVVTAAQDTHCDWVLAIGGGSAIGAAKLVALDRPGVQLAAVPTTYAGSERTDIWGRSQDGHKQTGRDARVRPRLVAYDPAFPGTMPRLLRLRSLLNALAHSIEALYASEATPAAQTAARASLGPLWRALGSPELPSEDSRAEALYGAWQASEALGGASMGLHHKLAHVLAGSFGTGHAPTHATLLPHTLGFNLPAAPGLLSALQEAWGVERPAAALFDRLDQLGLSTALSDLGLTAENAHEAARLATRQPYPNPRPLDREALTDLLEQARLGRRPTA